MKQSMKTSNPIQSSRINRFTYVIFLITAVYLLILGDYKWSVVNLSIALSFDPFDATVQWQYRPLYQKIWLLCHIVLALAGFAFLLFR